MTLHSIDKAKVEAHARLIEQMRRILGETICAVFDDPSAVEIMLNDDGRILVERHGHGITELTRMSPAKALNFLALMASWRETVVDRNRPIVEGAMPDEFRRARFAGCIPPRPCRRSLSACQPPGSSPWRTMCMPAFWPQISEII